MEFFILLILLVGLLFGIYQRYVPVYGVKLLDIEKETPREHVQLLDVRDYHLAAKYPVQGVFHLPYAYLKRHYGEIGSREIVLVVSDRLLLNLSVRFLRRKGFHIVGCYIT